MNLTKLTMRRPVSVFIILLALIVACVLWRTWGIANANPVESIKAE